MDPLYYVIGVTGSGKTTLAMKHALNHPTTNFFIALPSIQAIDEKANELFDLLDSVGVKRPVKRFYSRHGQETSVVEQIARHIEATPRDAGSIIFITHRAFAMMSHWYHADRWHGIIDEVPCISYSFSEPLPDNRHLLLDKLHMSPLAENGSYSIVDAKEIEEIKHIAVNPGGDRVNKIFQDLCEKLTTHLAMAGILADRPDRAVPHRQDHQAHHPRADASEQVYGIRQYDNHGRRSDGLDLLSLLSEARCRVS